MKIDSIYQEKAKPIANVKGYKLIIRSLFDIKLTSIFYSIRKYLKSETGSILDVGCGVCPYKFLIKNGRYTGIDHKVAKNFLYSEDDVIYYEGEEFPCDSSVFNTVFHTEVIEHILNAETFFKECFRVLKPGGKLLFTSPFSYRFHYIPYDYYRYTPSALSYLLKKSGFIDLEIKPQGSDITVICQKIIAFFFRMLTEKIYVLVRIIRIIITVFFFPFLFLINIIGQLSFFFSFFFSFGACNDTLGYLVVAKKPEGEDS